MSILNKLTEGIVNRDLRSEGTALLNKWEKTGLLEGLEHEHQRQGMARLLENQAKQLLKEASSMSGGDVEGFSAVAFPLVRRVFAGLIANDLVSVQPMSLPSGLIFFLDFTTSTASGIGTDGLPRLGYGSGSTEESLYGGGRIGAQITAGVDLTGRGAEAGPYALNNGYASPTASVALDFIGIASGIDNAHIVASGVITDGGICLFSASVAATNTSLGSANNADKYKLAGLLRFDPDLVSGSRFAVVSIPLSQLNGGTGIRQFNTDNMIAVTLTKTFNNDGRQARRLTRFDDTGAPTSTVDKVLLVSVSTGSETVFALSTSLEAITACTIPIADDFQAGAGLGSVIGDPTWGLEKNSQIPEIDIKVDSVAVTAITKKLKAKWTPELGQDLNAYHNLDAEVELTSILSEQIALEIDHEILEDLIHGATAGTYFWSRSPGLFLNRTTGLEVGASSAAPDFTGTVSEWYETLAETINDISAQIHRKTLRGGANFVVTSPEVANILEFTAGFRASVTHDTERGQIGAVKVGSLSKKWDVYVDPYFPRNLVLIGRRGGSFLESGYVYAPYVPLQVTPTIFGIEDFVPRKGVMTRYAKKMVRPDMYGLVVVRGLLGESGATS